MRASTKIALGAAAIVAGVYFGYGFVSSMMIDKEVFTPIKPGRVNLVGVDTGAGYRIIVSNQMAQLVENSGQGSDEAEDREREDDGSKRRIPLKELLQVLQGNEAALGPFVTRMNDELRQVNLPPNVDEISWTPDQITKALEGDAQLKAKLERQMNVGLNGIPPDRVSLNAVFDGIYIKLPVTINVPIEGKPTPMTGHIHIPYRPRFVMQFEMKVAQRAEDTDFVAGTYAADRQDVIANPKKAEDVAKALRDRIDPRATEQYALQPRRILESARVVLSDTFFESTSISSFTTTDGKKLFDLGIRLNDEGRRRLWQYSRQNVGNQLLLISDGAAIAAPRIRHELSSRDVTIKQLPDETLALEVKELIDEIAKNRKES